MMQIKKYRLFKILRLAISYLVLIIMAAFSIFPLYYVFMTSFSNAPNLISLAVSDLLPKHIYFTAYKYLFTTNLYGGSFPLWIRNSLILAGSTAIISVLLALITGYALSRLNVPAKKILATFIYIVTFFPYTASAVPLYLLFAKFHLLNYIGLILAYTPGTSIFAAFIAKLSIDSIPPSYEEIAMIDGLSRFGAFLRIVMRLALPVVALTALLGFSGTYLDFALAYSFLLPNVKEWTATIGLYYMAGLLNQASAPAYNIFAAGAVIMGIPLMALFIVSQRMMTRAYSNLAGVKQ
ncbi:sugar ABC transporter permease [Saccharolobus solfataricus]|nr:sugar ABC transporter permease [Saccharolobus solfataricus]AKA74358.1 sugar ABC transporter permease [Saccharolobus solfataricus]AKA77054.1 sugar ABC transporter permease [Saccharolobus solfataricus]AKA79746.1 sugar ABC transporter permease [Saccharolobus solfataricus]AZF68841.1 sugar ABC transporter permease [Saccharolobus solfataricus]AZF71461.1 sugar ABC transporter permease [Saccharolobus solfataricus]